MTPIRVAEVVHTFQQLGSLPAVRKRLFELADDPNVTLTDMAEVIAQDPSLTIRVIADAHKKSRRDICDVLTATKFMYRDDIMRSVEQTRDRDVFNEMDPHIVDFMDFWSHSVCCALAASAIARKSFGDFVSMYTIGLLHDVGRALLYLLRPREMTWLLKDCTEKAADGAEKERFELGIDHCEVASILFQHLGFSNRMCEVIRYHHEPYEARNYAAETYILHVAEAIAQEVRPGWKSGPGRDATCAINTNSMHVIPNFAEIIEVSRQEVEITFGYVSDLIQPGALS